MRGDVRIDWVALQRHKRSFTDPAQEKREHLYTQSGIDTYHGRARFSGPNTIVVGETTLAAPHVVITGAEVTILNRNAQPLTRFDPDLVNLLIKRSVRSVSTCTWVTRLKQCAMAATVSRSRHRPATIA